MTNEIYRERECVAPTFDWKAIRVAYLATRKRKGKLLQTEKDFLKMMKEFLTKIVQPQLDQIPLHGKSASVLRISNDEQIAEVLGCSTRQSKRIRNTLAEIGAFVLGVSHNGKKLRQYGPGTLPCWLLSFDFMIDDDHLLIPNPEAKERVVIAPNAERKQSFLKIRFPKKKKVNEKYRVIYTRHAIELREQFEIDFAEGADPMTQTSFDLIVERVADVEFFDSKH